MSAEIIDLAERRTDKRTTYLQQLVDEIMSEVVGRPVKTDPDHPYTIRMRELLGIMADKRDEREREQQHA